MSSAWNICLISWLPPFANKIPSSIWSSYLSRSGSAPVIKFDAIVINAFSAPVELLSLESLELLYFALLELLDFACFVANTTGGVVFVTSDYSNDADSSNFLGLRTLGSEDAWARDSIYARCFWLAEPLVTIVFSGSMNHPCVNLSLLSLFFLSIIYSVSSRSWGTD